MMDRLIKRWKQYRYRFVPWIAVNLKKRSVRSVPKGSLDKLASDTDILETLTKLLTAFHDSANCNDGTNSDFSRHACHDGHVAQRNLRVMREVMGFSVERGASTIAAGGRGVIVTKGCVPAGVITCLYPGLIYESYEPILVQSLANPFIFRCIDAVLVDGNDKGISKCLFSGDHGVAIIIFMENYFPLGLHESFVCIFGIHRYAVWEISSLRSCHGRDRMGPYSVCDESWLTDWPINPLAVGQYVNNHNRENSANVAYQELDVPAYFPLHLRKYLPNNFYSSCLDRIHEPQRKPET